MSPTNWIATIIVFLIVVGVLALRAVQIDKTRAKNKADGVVAFIGDVRLTNDALLVGENRYPLTGLHATVEDSGSVNRRLTLTRLATLGVAAVAIPKKLDDRDVYVTIEGPGVAVVRVMHVRKVPNAGGIARQFAARLNMMAQETAQA